MQTLILVNPFDVNRRLLRPDLPRSQTELWRTVGACYGDIAARWVRGSCLLVAPEPPVPALLRLPEEGERLVVCPPGDVDLAQAVQDDPEAWGRLLAWARAQEGPLVVTAWGPTPPFYGLVDRLRTHLTRPVISDLGERAAYGAFLQLDGKASLRARAADAGLAMPPGAVCHDLEEAAEVAARGLATGTAQVVKANRGVSGIGVLRLDPPDAPEDPDALRNMLRDHWKSLPLPCQGPFVVEAAIGPPGGAVFATARLTPGDSHLLGGGLERRDAHNLYKGALIRGLPDPAIREAFARLTSLAAGLGVQGELGADYRIDDAGTPWLLEVNPRRCSESHAHALAARFFGPAWHDGVGVALSRLPLRLAAPAPDPDAVLAAFAHCARGVGAEGRLVPAALSWLTRPSPGLGYVIVARDEDAATSIEARLHQALRDAGLTLKDTDHAPPLPPGAPPLPPGS